MSKEVTKQSSSRLKRFGITGAVIGFLSILACELPLVLAFVGIGGLTAAKSFLPFPLGIEAVAIFVGFIVLKIGIGFLVYRRFFREAP